jgi:toxoflavin synthase
MTTPTDPRELYDDTAQRWVRTAPTSLSDFTARPALLDLCEPIAAARILDLGCGEGYCSRLLKRRGAASVLGMDLSGQMIAAALAEEGRAPLGIEYTQGNAIDLSMLAAESFDVVLAVFLFNYLDCAAMSLCMGEVARLLGHGGKFVFAVPHPSFAFLHAPLPPFYFDVGRNGYFSARNQRFAGKIWRRDKSYLDVQTVHKTLEDYFVALSRAGFVHMPLVRELHVTPEILSMDEEFFAPLQDVPLHLAIALVR